MPSLHELIMAAAAKNAKAPVPKVKTDGRNKLKPEAFRITKGLTLAVTPALLAQMHRYAEANPRPNKKTGEFKPMSISKLIRYAVYEALEDSSKASSLIYTKPRVIPMTCLPPERPHQLSWTLNNKDDRKHFDHVCSANGLTPSVFTRRAIYNYTKDFISADPKEHLQAASDGWK